MQQTRRGLDLPSQSEVSYGVMYRNLEICASGIVCIEIYPQIRHCSRLVLVKLLHKFILNAFSKLCRTIVTCKNMHVHAVSWISFLCRSKQCVHFHQCVVVTRLWCNIFPSCPCGFSESARPPRTQAPTDSEEVLEAGDGEHAVE